MTAATALLSDGYERIAEVVRGRGPGRIVDTSWDPPVSLGVRLVSVLSDDLQHAGQAAYVRGLAQRHLGR